MIVDAQSKVERQKEFKRISLANMESATAMNETYQREFADKIVRATIFLMKTVNQFTDLDRDYIPYLEYTNILKDGKRVLTAKISPKGLPVYFINLGLFSIRIDMEEIWARDRDGNFNPEATKNPNDRRKNISYSIPELGIHKPIFLFQVGSRSQFEHTWLRLKTMKQKIDKDGVQTEFMSVPRYGGGELLARILKDALMRIDLNSLTYLLKKSEDAEIKRKENGAIDLDAQTLIADTRIADRQKMEIEFIVKFEKRALKLQQKNGRAAGKAMIFGWIEAETLRARKNPNHPAHVTHTPNQAESRVYVDSKTIYRMAYDHLVKVLENAILHEREEMFWQLSFAFGNLAKISGESDTVEEPANLTFMHIKAGYGHLQSHIMMKRKEEHIAAMGREFADYQGTNRTVH